MSNLKTATDRVSRIQVELLLEHALDKRRRQRLYTAMHFCNLIKVSRWRTFVSPPGRPVRLVPGEP